MEEGIRGKIVKGIAGFYYVYTALGLIECKAKGAFRNEGLKPLIGDDVLVSIIDEGERTGNIISILPRTNAIIRPAAANIDQAVIIFAITRPSPNYNLLDRFLIMMKKQDIPCVIAFNKSDIASEDEIFKLKEAYSLCGNKVLFLSGKNNEGMDELKCELKGKTSIVAGPSGVGKSTIVNTLYPEASVKTGELSIKIERGKHTTRHTELFTLSGDTYIMDTPGFTSLSVEGVSKEELWRFYPEFLPYEENCRFSGCSHINENVCGIKQALSEKKISAVRYENYRLLYNELKDLEKRR